MQPPHTFHQEDVARTFSQLASTWSSKNIRVQSHDGVRNRLMELLPTILTPSDNLLDVGCGDGKVAALLRRSNVKNKILMIDGAEGMVRAAMNRFQHDPDAQVESGHLEDFVSRDSREFEVLTALQVLHHVADLKSFLSAAKQALIPNGHVVALTVGDQFHKEAIPFVRPEHDPLGRKSSQEWGKEFEAAGFFVTTVIDDYFGVRFLNSADYIDYLRSIGSLSKMVQYKSSDISPPHTQSYLQEAAKPLELTGHHVTIVARKRTL